MDTREIFKDKYNTIQQALNTALEKCGVEINPYRDYIYHHFEKYNEIKFEVFIYFTPRREMANYIMTKFHLDFNEDEVFRSYRHIFTTSYDNFNKLYALCKLKGL